MHNHLFYGKMIEIKNQKGEKKHGDLQQSKIISDSTCDLSPELIAKYNIDILPLHILLGENEYEDGKNIAPDQFMPGP